MSFIALRRVPTPKGKDTVAPNELNEALAAVERAFDETVRGRGATIIQQTQQKNQNLRGTATFAAGTTVAVVFANAEKDTSYFVAIAPQGNPGGNVWVSAKTTSGFTLNCSASTSIAVDWIKTR
jgi:hypothetical protein